ncbi:MAG: hypothetical protein KIT36_08840 [Alphaproteobacteria bacterium]|nr:hypothetical protein [Alphaproteobacteria bacterium]
MTPVASPFFHAGNNTCAPAPCPRPTPTARVASGFRWTRCSHLFRTADRENTMTRSRPTRFPPPAAAAVATLAMAMAMTMSSAIAHDPPLRAPARETPVIPSPVAVPLDAGALAALPREPVTARAHEATLTCEGVPLFALLRASGAIPEGPLRSAQLSRYVMVDARDGYRVLFSLAELDPGTGKRGAWLVDRCDGAALGDKDGPLRLLVPDDARAARSVRQVEAIHVVVAP